MERTLGGVCAFLSFWCLWTKRICNNFKQVFHECHLLGDIVVFLAPLDFGYGEFRESPFQTFLRIGASHS